ncbi:hypothetical protein M4951_06040 [Blastopirellula sp. J2-11]|uniref:hypothetical protein n=1 Tax=Blastopirellula sp. J2-11 TaxID=2943192 RepID=UPI0021C8239D|nr:hypothetical protein [Blastopirellula sp. J2-11]UUO07871.1 hypothetical protein M4951_06040 [Blastopirellula sp. J2-11]
MSESTGFTSLSSRYFMNYQPIEIGVLRMFFDNPDAFISEGFDPRDIDFDIQVDLKRHSVCRRKRLIVLNQLRVCDVKILMLQSLVWPSMYAYAAHIVRNAADILIAHSRIQGAWMLVDAFFETADDPELRVSLSMPVTVRLSDFETSHRNLENAVQVFVIGHEIGHHLAPSAQRESVSGDDVELVCDASGLELACRFDETEFFWTVEAGWDGPEPMEQSAIGGVWGIFEHLVTALLWGDAMLRRTGMRCKGESHDPFPLAKRRTEAMITKFRSSDRGRRHPAFGELLIEPLQLAFMKIDALVTSTIDLGDDRFSVRVTRDRNALLNAHYDLEAHWADRLLSLGLKRSIGGVLIPQEADHPGMDNWSRVYQNSVMSPPEPYGFNPNLPGKEFRHRHFGRRDGFGFRSR